ncbi:MAG TPA: tetratricopeptide repeat protein, partial [Saprospiraceae bacterium]|nr:tetratricopeptide repeat protein [Saprospiraceae bacterium]
LRIIRRSAILLIVFFLLKLTNLPAQQKGATPISNVNGQQSVAKNTFAVVVGISDYQDPSIPDLRFADKDAEAFANFLRSPSGGSLDGDHLKLLLNKDATVAQFAIALDWLIENAKEGDQVIIYFSGHGDVEKKTLTQPGFLLCWDAPSKVYMAGGAFNLRDVQEVVSTLSVQNKSKVVVITDACRSGTLAGQSIGGAQATAANLAKQYANEIKILSCQPNEYSIEGEQWGGGRGAFSYNLVNALYGLADNNNDQLVTLYEVGRYLEDHVTAEVAPVSQVPLVVGSRTEKLSSVDTKLLAQLRSGQKSQMALLSAVDSRGVEDEVLAGVDTSIRKMYLAFKKALKEKIFFEPQTACADYYYEQLIAEPKLARLHSTMRRNYAALLQDETQQTLNEWLKGAPDASMTSSNKNDHSRITVKEFDQRIRSYPRCIDRAAELLGPQHYMYRNLQARRNFFEGFLVANSDHNPNKDVGQRALQFFRSSLEWMPDQPHVYWQMSHVFAFSFQQIDSLEYYTQKAIDLQPGWILPCVNTAFLLGFNYAMFDKAKYYLERANKIDSNNVEVVHMWAIYYMKQKKYPEAERLFFKAIALDSTEAGKWLNLGFLYTEMSRYNEAETALKKAISIDSTRPVSWHNLGFLYNSMRRYEEAEYALKRSIALDSTLINNWTSLGSVYNRSKRYAEAEKVLRKALILDSTSVTAWNGLGFCYFNTGRYQDAEPIFLRIVRNNDRYIAGWNNLGNIYRELNRPEEAEKMYAKAFSIDSSFMPTYINYIQLKSKLNDPEAGFVYLEKLLKLGYNNYTALQGEDPYALLRAQSERWKALMQKYFPEKVNSK